MRKLILLFFLALPFITLGQVTQTQVDAFKGTATGTNSYSVTINPVMASSPYDNQTISVRFTNGNTGAATLKLNNYAAIAINLNGAALVSGDIPAGAVYLLKYNSVTAKWDLIKTGFNPSSIPSLTFTSPLVNTTNTVTINNADADGSTKGAASFTAADFNATTGNISIDYANGQAATSGQDGFLQSADWTTFNNKLSGLTANSTSISGGTSGSVLFNNAGTLGEDPTQFFWDNTNNRLGIGIATPTATIHGVGAGNDSSTSNILITSANGRNILGVGNGGNVGINLLAGQPGVTRGYIPDCALEVCSRTNEANNSYIFAAKSYSATQTYFRIRSNNLSGFIGEMFQGWKHFGNMGFNINPDSSRQVQIKGWNTSASYYPLVITDGSGGNLFNVQNSGRMNLFGYIATNPLATHAAIPSVYGGLAINTVKTTIAASGDGSAGLRVVGTDAVAAGNGGFISLEATYDASNKYAMATIAGIKENGTSGNSAGALVLSTHTSGIGSMNEALRINSSQNVGIGTTNPLSPLHIERTYSVSSTYPELWLKTTDGVYGGLAAGTNGSFLSFQSTKFLDICTVTGPNAAGYVTHTRFFDDGTLALGTAGSGFSHGNDASAIITANAERDGILGIDLTNRSTGGSAYTTLYFGGGSISTTNGPVIGMVGSGNSALGGAGSGFFYNNGNYALTFGTNASERMRINNSGEIGIGVTAASGTKFQVKGSGATSSTFTGLFENSSGADLLTIRDDGYIGAGNAVLGTLVIGTSASAATSIHNTCFGVGAGGTSSGGYNTAFGENALGSAVAGDENTAVGRSTLFALTSGGNNVAMGTTAAAAVTSGNGNVAIGRDALLANQTGSYVTAIGYRSLYNYNTAGTSYNTALGYASGLGLTTGQENTIIGASAGQSITTGAGNTILGSECAGSATGSLGVFIGTNAGFYETGNSKLFIDNRRRSNEADGRVKALIYGEFATNPIDQRLTINATITTQDSLDRWAEEVVVADDGTIVMPSATSGWGTVMAFNSGTCDGVVSFRYNSDGSVTEMAVADALNSAVADTDTKLCVFDSGTTVTIKNRLGGTRTLKLTIHY